MRIERVDLLPFSIPLARPLRTARGTIRERSGWIVRLRAEEGTVGLGEAAAHPHAAPAAAEREAGALAPLGASLSGACLDRFEDLVADLRTLPRWIAAGVDCALWDLRARAAGRSLAATLGGRRARIPVNAVLDASDAEGCVEQGAAVARAGFTHAKRKIGSDLAETVREVRALAAAVPHLAVRLDANGVWSNAQAHAACARLSSENVEWIEQPLAPGDLTAMARLRREAPVPLAADESVRSKDDVDALAGEGAADAIVVKLVQVGGVSEGCQALGAAARAGLPAAVTSGVDTTVGLAAALAVASAAPGTLAACGLATGSMLAGDPCRTRLAEGPSMAVPDGPGLGVELDPEAWTRFRGHA